MEDFAIVGDASSVGFNEPSLMAKPRVFVTWNLAIHNTLANNVFKARTSYPVKAPQPVQT